MPTSHQACKAPNVVTIILLIFESLQLAWLSSYSGIHAKISLMILMILTRIVALINISATIRVKIISHTFNSVRIIYTISFPKCIISQNKSKLYVLHSTKKYSMYDCQVLVGVINLHGLQGKHTTSGEQDVQHGFIMGNGYSLVRFTRVEGNTKQIKACLDWVIRNIDALRFRKIIWYNAL